MSVKYTSCFKAKDHENYYNPYYRKGIGEMKIGSTFIVKEPISGIGELKIESTFKVAK